MSSEARAATNDGSTPRARTASAVTGPTAAMRVSARIVQRSPAAATPFTLVKTTHSYAARFSSAASSGRWSLGRANLDERHDRNLSAETFEGVGERLRFRARHHDAPA